MAERSLFEKLINPTEEEKEEIISGVKEGQKYLNILSKEGFSGFVKRAAEEELIEQGLPEKEIRKRAKEVEKFENIRRGNEIEKYKNVPFSIPWFFI